MKLREVIICISGTQYLRVTDIDHSLLSLHTENKKWKLNSSRRNFSQIVLNSLLVTYGVLEEAALFSAIIQHNFVLANYRESIWTDILRPSVWITAQNSLLLFASDFCALLSILSSWRQIIQQTAFSWITFSCSTKKVFLFQKSFAVL